MSTYLFKGEFNWYGQCFTLWRHAKTKTMAKYFFMMFMAETVDRDISAVKHYFDGTRNNYQITKEEKNEKRKGN